MILAGILFLVFIVCIAMMWTEGMWGNALSFVNTIFAAMIATNYWEPLADLIEEQLPSYTYLWDFLSIWLLFAITFGISRAITDTLSKHKVRFKLPVEHGGRAFFAAATGWVLICFTTTTLHMAPIPQVPFGGSFAQDPDHKCLFGLAPDRLWLGYMQSRSRGALSRGDESASSPHKEDKGKRVFDPRSEFMMKYAVRRGNYAVEKEMRVEPATVK